MEFNVILGKITKLIKFYFHKITLETVKWQWLEKWKIGKKITLNFYIWTMCDFVLLVFGTF